MAAASEIPFGGHGMAGMGAIEPIEGFSHLTVEVKDLDRAERWYQDVIGLDLLGRGLLAEPQNHSLMRMESGQLLVLLECENPRPIRPNTSSIHHAFLLTMDQYRAAQKRFEAAGYDISDTRATFRAKGEYSMDIFDPDGHRWQVQAYSEEAHEVIKPGVGVVNCGPAEGFGISSVTTFREGNFFLVREEAGFAALSRWCRHMNGLLSYQKEHWRFYCAFHGATYDLEGNHVGHLPEIQPMRFNPVSFSPEGDVLVDTDVVIERPIDSDLEFTPTPAFAVAVTR